MNIEQAVRHVQGIAREIQVRESLALPAEMREEARADRVALEIVCEWAMKAYKKDNELGAEMLNALHV